MAIMGWLWDARTCGLNEDTRKIAVAIESDADEATIEADDMSLTYHSENTNRVKIKVVGNLAR